MNTKNNFFKIMIVAAAISVASCNKNVLDENLTTARSLEYYKTDAGILSLATGTYYQVLSTPFNGEFHFSSTNYGTDEFKTGGDNSNGVWNAYDAGLKSIVSIANGNTIQPQAQWDNLYIGIGDANLLIESAIASTSTADAIKKVALGEGYFFRAYNYLRLVSQYGAVPLKIKSSNSVELEFTRADPKDVYDQIVKDFTNAYNLLPNTGAPAKVTKDAVAHYLAKTYLSRASEINNSWNGSTKAADLAAIGPLCDAVIANHPLASNFGALWNYTAADGANEKLPELILSAQFTTDPSQTGQNTQHLYYGSRYEDISQMQRDITGGRPFSRLATTYFMYRVYDQINDSRFWKSFRTKYRANKTASPYVNGDLGIIYIINQPGDTRFSGFQLTDANIPFAAGTLPKNVPWAFVAYPKTTTADGSLYGTSAGTLKYPSLSKFMDGSRLALNNTNGYRDITLARSAETYLIAAEAKIRLAAAGSAAYTDALPYINALRTRAQYQSGEIRSAYTDGGNSLTAASLQSATINAFFPENSYYESNNIPATTAASSSLAISNIALLPAVDEYIISTLGLSSTYDRMLCLILNERSRELCGEFKRWEDLSRTKTLVARAKTFNPEAKPNIQDYHALRPIPQTYLDAIQISGLNLTPAQKTAQQNPGY